MRYGEYLIKNNYITQDVLDIALEKQKQTTELGRSYPIGNVFVEMGILTEEDVCKTLTLYNNNKKIFTPIQTKQPDLTLVKHLRTKDYIALQAVPLCYRNIEDGNKNLQIVVASICQDIMQQERAMEKFRQLFPRHQIVFRDVLEISFAKFINMIADKTNDTKETTIEITAPEKLRQIFRIGIKERASDVYIFPTREEIILRYKVGGLLWHCKQVPISKSEYSNIWRSVFSATGAIEGDLKTKGFVDMALRDLTGDGSWQARCNAQQCIQGVALCFRLIPNREAIWSIDELKMTDPVSKYLHRIPKVNHGLCLATGHMGTGKNTSIYAILKARNDGNHQIITVEDPVEKVLDGINQVQVGEHNTYESVASSVVRQAIDTAFLGEIRNKESLEIALQLGVEGALVLSTLHIEALNKMFTRVEGLSNGCAKRFISGLKFIFNQKLVSTLCPKCKRKLEISELAEPGREDERIMATYLVQHGYDGYFYTADGCDYCQNRGYRGSAICAEFLNITFSFIRGIYSLPNMLDAELYVQNYLNQTKTSFYFDGMLRLKHGVTSLSELLSKGVLVNDSAVLPFK